MVGILVHGDNHFIVRGRLPDRDVARALIRHCPSFRSELQHLLRLRNGASARRIQYARNPLLFLLSIPCIQSDNTDSSFLGQAGACRCCLPVLCANLPRQAAVTKSSRRGKEETSRSAQRRQQAIIARSALLPARILVRLRSEDPSRAE
jgi:hypothetical protein